MARMPRAFSTRRGPALGPDARRAALGRAREEIDALNVYPVPDGDTGTNLYLTLRGRAGRPGASATPPRTPAAAPDLAGRLRPARAAPRGPRQLGVILSQLLRGLGRRSRREPGRRTARTSPDAAARCGGPTTRPGEAVARPVEGTILSVAAGPRRRRPRSAAEAAARPARRRRRRLEAAREALGAHPGAARRRCAAPASSTPGRRGLRPGPRVPGARHLRRGGTGLRRRRAVMRAARRRRPRRARSPAVVAVHGRARGRRRMRTTARLRGDVPARRARARRGRPCAHVLDGLGDSLLVVGGAGLWNVHVHVDDAGRGRRGRHRGRAPASDPDHPPRRAACAAPARTRPTAPVGRSSPARPGRAWPTLFEHAGAVVVRSAPGRRASDRGAPRRDPPDARRRRSSSCPTTATPSSRRRGGGAGPPPTTGIEVARRPRATRPVQGLAALAVHDPARRAPTTTWSRMAAPRPATRHGAVTVATRDALTDRRAVPGGRRPRRRRRRLRRRRLRPGRRRAARSLDRLLVERR